jgi:hypothetical protein
MKKIVKIAIETMFMLTLFAAGMVCPRRILGVDNSFLCGIVRHNQERLRYELRQCNRFHEDETCSR